MAGQALDRIYQVKNGLGARSTVTYADGLASGVVTTPNNVALAYPQHVAGSPGKVVQRISHENGVAGDRSTVYAYQDPAIDVAGRGALGYAQVSSTDEQTGIVTISTFGLVWPYTGNALTTSVSSGGIVLSSTVNALAVQSITQANGAKTSFVYTSNSKLCRKDLDGSDLGCSSTDVSYDTWGNQLSQATGYSVGGVDSGFSNRIDNTYKTCSANWMPSLPVQTSTTKTDPVSGTLTRTMAYDYDCASGLIKTSTVEPDDGTLTVATTYGRTNAFGLVNTTTQSWQNPFNGQMMSRIVSDVSYDANGRYPLSVKNALGHTENYTYEAGTGARKTLQDINGLGSSWVTDGFGRVTKEVHPDGNEVRSYVKQCAGDCPPQATMARIIDTIHGSDRITVPTVSYADAVGHVLRTLTWGFDGRAVNIDQHYDEVKRVYEADQPRFDGATAFLASRQEHDILNRVILSSAMSEAGTLATTRTDRSGFTTVVTNALTQRRTETRNVLGQLIQVKDPNNKLTSFGYEPFGALNNTIDPNGNVIQVGYDLWGRKTLLKDPDLGLVTYGVDPLGRTYQQLTPKLRVAKHAGGSLPGVLMFYDDLDRMINRAEPDLSSYWVYDGAANGKGKLQEAYTMIGTVKDYDRTHSYDSLGRPLLTSQRLQLISYTAQNVYDAWGRPIQQMYQRGTDAAKKFDLRYNNTGYMVRLERGSQALWKVTKQDAAARVTGTLLGNGLSQSRTFNDYTARLSGASLTTPASVEHLSEGYTYDVLGSVLTRDQHWDGAGFHEDFTYDNLNRLGTSTVQGQAKQTFTYDDAGNMLSKTGVGTGVYAYPVQGPTAVQPHAVQSIVGLSGSFVYDKNGNLTSSPGRTTTWTSFDMPLQLAKGAITANFVYGPEHQRTRQDRSDGSSVIYAGAQEVESKAGQVTVKTYWPLGVGVEIDRPGATASELNWTHLDRLGSPVAMTDDKGNLREKLAYDAWGKRRTLDGASTPDALDGQTDNRGFTGHEMLDQLDLVHMNGRVYDPLVGKFLSGDPLVQDPMNGQSYNRYSYVLNNPTNLTDPTGFRPQCYAGVGLFSTCAPSFMSQLLDGARQGFDNFVKFATATPEPGKVDAKKGQVIVKNVQPAAAPQEDSANSGGNGGGTKSGCDPGPSCVYVPGKREGGSNLSPADKAVIDGLIKDYPITPHCITARCSMTEKIQAFGSGAWSVAKGTGNAVRFVVRGTGLMGAEEQKRWKQEGDGVQSLVEKYQSDKEFADEVDHAVGQALGKMYTNNQDGWLKAFMLGRISTGVITGLGPAAAIGDTTRKVEEGHSAADSLLKGGILGQ